MKNQYIKFSVEHQVIQRTDSFFVVGGSVNYLKARFSFCDDWSDEEQIAIFTGGGHSYAVTLTNGECVVPWEVLRLKKFYVSCMAGERITSNAVSVKVCPSGIGDELQKYLDPTPTVFDEKIKNAVEQYMKDNPVEDNSTGKIDYTDVTEQYKEHINSGGSYMNFFFTLGAGKYCVDDGFRVYRCKNIEYCGCLYSTVKTYGDDQIFTEELLIDGVKVYEVESSTEQKHSVISNIGKPIRDKDAANKKYVDDSIKEAIGGLKLNETDPTVSDWAKAKEKPSYSASEIAANMTIDEQECENVGAALNALANRSVVGGEEKWEYIGRFNVPEDSVEVEFTHTEDGKPIKLKKMYFEGLLKGSATGTEKVNMSVGNPIWSNPYGANVKMCTPQLRPNSEQVSTNGMGYHCYFIYAGGYNRFITLTKSGAGGVGVGGNIASNNPNEQYFGGLCARSDDTSKCLIGAGTYFDIWGVWDE